MSSALYMVAMLGVVGVVWIVYTAYEAILWSRPGTIKAEIMGTTGDVVTVRAVVTKHDTDGFSCFRYKKTTYSVDYNTQFIKRARVASGLVTVPKLYYRGGMTNPVNWTELKLGDAIDSAAVDTARNNHLVKEAFETYGKEGLSLIVVMLVLGGIVILSAFAVYKTIDTKITNLTNIIELQAIDNTPTNGEFDGNKQ